MSAAGENATELHATAAAPAHETESGRREFRVIEGLTVAARVLRFLGTTLLVTFIVGLVGALVLHATIIESQRALDTQKRDIARIEQETESMRQELAELEAPARVVAEAHRLGMIEAPGVLYLNTPGGELDSRILNAAANQLQAGR